MRWRIVLLLVLLTASAGTLFSQSCTAIGPVPPAARPNGHAELMGDIILACTGSFSGQYSFLVNLLNAPVTSHALTTGPTPSLESLLLVNDPAAGSQIACAASQAALGTCPTGSNVFQAALYSTNSLAFSNVPLPASGPFFLRITNVRADVAGLSGPITPVMAQIAATGIPISNSTQNIAYVSGSDGINVQLRTSDDSSALPVGGLALSRCTALNPTLATNPSSASAPDGVSFVLRVQENFGTVFKKMATPATPPPDVNTRPAPAPQDVPGLLYNMETGFYNPAFPTTGGLNAAGLATQATRIWIRFQSPIGVQVHAPVYEKGKGLTNSRVRLIWSNADGSGLTYTPLGPTSPVLGTYYDTAHAPYYLYVYEITAIGGVNPAQIDTIDLPFYFAYPASPSVGLGPTTAQVELAPISTNSTYLPRFAEVSVPFTVATTTAPALQAVIDAKTGPQNARLWQIGINDYGTAPATNVAISKVTFTQTYGATCSTPPSVVSGIPGTWSSIPANSTLLDGVTINFSGCPTNARFTVVVTFTADCSAGGSTTFYNQTQ
jgi:hypothetical protein